MNRCEECKHFSDISTKSIHAGFCRELLKIKHIKTPACGHFQILNKNNKNEHKCRSCKNYEHVNQKEYFCHAFGDLFDFADNEFESCFHFKPQTETTNND